jgi:AraC-like DNA-binding protein
MYYIIDGDAFYEEDGKKTKFKKGHLYFTPTKKVFNVYDDPENQLLHTYAHITTSPPITEFIEIEVIEGSPLFDAVALWRKYIHTKDFELLGAIINLVLSIVDTQIKSHSSLAGEIKNFIDATYDYQFNTAQLCRKLGYSREYIIRNFSSVYGITPKKYFNVGRMNAGLEKLISGTSVKETAALINFSSPYAFSKAFKNHFGMSPEKYISFLKNTQNPKNTD